MIASKESLAPGINAMLQSAKQMRLTVRRSIVISLVFTILVTLYMVRSETLNSPYRQAYRPLYSNAGESEYSRAVKASGNATLGFHQIRFINAPGRYDRRDAVILQGYVTGLEITEEKGVDFDDIAAEGRPITSAPDRVTDAEIAAWRSHANVWGDILRDRNGPILILEADATWDVNTRISAATANREFVKFLDDINSIPARVGFNPLDTPGDALSRSDVRPNADDPWLSEHWDILNFGVCREGSSGEEVFRTWPDRNVKPGFNSGALRLDSERGVRLSGAPTCTKAYAVSERGAAKLLMRSMLNLDNPRDLLINSMVKNGELLAYTIVPDLFSQWAYKSQLGASNKGYEAYGTMISKRDGDSDEEKKKKEEEEEKKKKEEEEKKKKEEEEKKKKEEEKQAKLQKMREDQERIGELAGWDSIMETKNAWDIRGIYKNRWSRFKQPALSSAWEYIFSDRDLSLAGWDQAVSEAVYSDPSTSKTSFPPGDEAEEKSEGEEGVALKGAETAGEKTYPDPSLFTVPVADPPEEEEEDKQTEKS